MSACRRQGRLVHRRPGQCRDGVRACCRDARGLRQYRCDRPCRGVCRSPRFHAAAARRARTVLRSDGRLVSRVGELCIAGSDAWIARTRRRHQQFRCPSVHARVDISGVRGSQGRARGSGPVSCDRARKLRRNGQFRHPRLYPQGCRANGGVGRAELAIGRQGQSARAIGRTRRGGSVGGLSVVAGGWTRDGSPDAGRWRPDTYVMGVGSMSDNVTEKRADVVVLGAGVCGVSGAFAARQRGLSVILVDRREPGSETSYGNAGILSSGSILPLNKPSLWSALPAYMTNRHAALRWDPGWAIRNIDWLVRFLANATPSRTKPRATALHGLIGASLKLHREWIVKADAAQRIRETGWLKAWRRGGGGGAKPEQAFLAEYGIESRLLDRQAISALEPNILPIYKVGLLHTQTASVDSPGAVVKAYARMFASSGGEIRRSEIKALMPDAAGWRRALAAGGVAARHVVVALGPWSADLLRPLGYRVPLAFERGYHREFKPNPARSLQRPIHDAEGSFLMTSMEQGIRVTTGVELTARDAPSSFAQLDAVVPVPRR